MTLESAVQIKLLTGVEARNPTVHITHIMTSMDIPTGTG